MPYIKHFIYIIHSVWEFYVESGDSEKPPAESVFYMNCTESPVSDKFAAVIPDFEQCAELIVKHCRGGKGEINAASEKPPSWVLNGNHRY